MSRQNGRPIGLQTGISTTHTQMGDCTRAVIWMTMAVVHRRLVRCGLVAADTFRVEAADDKVWLHHVERDEQGHPVPGQIDRWLNLLWAPPGADAVLYETVAASGNCS
jgi:uncharacterized ferritin-like protein (DUF455 family)